MSNVFNSRITAPATLNKNWTHWTKGGLNYCMLIAGASVLPNCVGYAWGRWLELMSPPINLSRGNAENWWGKNDGYARGSTPKLGAVACWRKGQANNESDGAGHVSIVEDILPDGSIITSNSAYAGSTFYMRTIKPPFNMGSAFAFQGFIYPPIEFVKANPVPLKGVGVVAVEVLNGLWGNGADRKAKLIAAGYDYNEVQAKVNIIFSQKYPKKTVNDIAKEVIAGKWGNGLARKNAIIKAGYNYTEVQTRVNELLK